VRVGAVELHVEERGEGPPLLLLHGFGGCSQNWAPFAAELSRQHRLLLVDLRGHGWSTNPGGVFAHRDAAADVLALLDALELERCAAMGMSSGAMTLLHVATQQPHRLDAMVLISATTHFPDQARAIMRRASFDTLPADVREMYRECAKRGDGQVRALLGQFNALATNRDDMAFTEPLLPAVTARTLVVHGERDVFFPVSVAEALASGIRGAELWVVPGGEHVPIIDPAVPFCARALRFLNPGR
jgi:pimeloyl-ACP methyl ester carboxylesterase